MFHSGRFISYERICDHMARFASGETTHRYDAKVPSDVIDEIDKATTTMSSNYEQTIQEVRELNNEVENVRQSAIGNENDIRKLATDVNNIGNELIFRINMLFIFLHKVCTNPIVRFFNLFMHWYVVSDAGEIYLKSGVTGDNYDFNLTNHLRNYNLPV